MFDEPSKMSFIASTSTPETLLSGLKVCGGAIGLDGVTVIVERHVLDDGLEDAVARRYPHPSSELMCTPWPEFEIVSLYMYRKTGSPTRPERVTAPGVFDTPPFAPVQSR